MVPAGKQEGKDSGDTKEAESTWLVDLAGERVEKMQPGIIPKGLTWLMWKPKTQLSEKRSSEKGAGWGVEVRW